MAEETMPAAEVELEGNDEQNHYELAFHILPTVADEEVPTVCADIKALVTRHGGEVTDEEAAQRMLLAYTIEKSIEGKYQRFSESFFGWVRFMLAPVELAKLAEEIDHRSDILRYMTIRLTRAEAAQPHRVFEKLQSADIVEDDVEAVQDSKKSSDDDGSGKDLDESLEEITS